jgi:phage shock protein A
MVEVMGTDGILRKVILPQEPAENFADILHTTDHAADATARKHRAAEAAQAGDWSAWDRWAEAHVERALAEYREKIQRPLLAELLAEVRREHKNDVRVLKAQLDAAERNVAGLQAQVDKLTDAQSLKE